MIATYRTLLNFYGGLHIAVGSTPPRTRTLIEARMNALSSFIHENAGVFSSDLSDNATNYQIFNDIKIDLEGVRSEAAEKVIQEIELIFNHSNLLRLSNNAVALAKWLNENQIVVHVAASDFTTDQGKIIKAFDAIKREPFQTEFEMTLSHMVVISLDLRNKPPLQVHSLFRDTELRLRALAHYTNVKKTPLLCLGLTSAELKRIAPHLTYVDCTNILFTNEEEVQGFLQECTKANAIKINSSKITELSQLPAAVLSLNCSTCPSLRRLTLSNLQSLRKLDCSLCRLLKELILSNLTALDEIDCSENPSLETFVSSAIPSCNRLDHHSCPLLRQLPQLPPGVNVISYNSITFTSFQVDFCDLNERPLDVLCHLGEMILKDKRMPNIVYLHSPGLDHGGLRRQLVTTLLKNLFVEGVFPLLQERDEKKAQGFKVLGALIGLAALGSLPLGRLLPRGFYYALLNTSDLDEEKIYNLANGDPDAALEEKRSMALPIYYASQGFHAMGGKFDGSLEAFINRVAGDEISWVNFEMLAVFKEDEEGKTKKYFEVFFKKYEKNPEKLADMIELFTASRALGREPIKIFVDHSLNKESLFRISTCFQQVTIPLYESFEVFEQKLFKTVEYTSSQFDNS